MEQQEGGQVQSPATPKRAVRHRADKIADPGDDAPGLAPEGGERHPRGGRVTLAPGEEGVLDVRANHLAGGPAAGLAEVIQPVGRVIEDGLPGDPESVGRGQDRRALLSVEIGPGGKPPHPADQAIPSGRLGIPEWVQLGIVEAEAGAPRSRQALADAGQPAIDVLLVRRPHEIGERLSNQLFVLARDDRLEGLGEDEVEERFALRRGAVVGESQEPGLCQGSASSASRPAGVFRFHSRMNPKRKRSWTSRRVRKWVPVLASPRSRARSSDCGMVIGAGAQARTEEITVRLRGPPVSDAMSRCT